MDTNDIAFALPGRTANHNVLYLRDGRIATIYVPTGKLESVVHLPTDDELNKQQAETKKIL